MPVVSALATCLCGNEAVGGVSDGGDGGAGAGGLLISLLPLIVGSLHDNGQIVHLLCRREFTISVV